ncbi:helix-turn-helix transcriptional regulator [Hymenobacter weizhouensis]|uniref:helix-turn-helix transcriptional regulator n=1 Tax=Hymenobacter sp. YIM 151500-1 TaxID=2987689 RepID=UPI0022267AF0|nr:AraC family transcriptional regulator [Hymenobacter sp. YIM 151500-1]UYZ63555.1 AraC family transcriptional regulator [Hymenobacter sp. YIM 151500-1]
MPTPIPKKILARQHEITADFRREVDQHLADIVAGRATEMWEIRDLAARLCIHPTHLSNTVKLTTGHSPCTYFEARIMDIARQQLQDPHRSVADIAQGLTFDPSNFTKFFKRFEGCTPLQYRERVRAEQRAAPAEKTETVTI